MIYGLKIYDSDLNIINTPMNPITIAVHRLIPTLLFRIHIAKIVVIIILENATAVTAARGRSLNDLKNAYIAITASTDFKICKFNFFVFKEACV